MTTATSRRQPELTRQTVVVIGGGADIGLQTARGTRSGSPPPVPRSVEPGWLP